MEMASAASWIPEDDLLLKNAVEAGASLEALAKGAVQFSRRYTLQELQGRWHSLLYDSEVAAEASVRMVELELSGANPLSKFNRTDNVKGSKDAGKRKSDSIRNQYYILRKKFRSEFFNPTDPGFLDEPNLHGCNGHGTDIAQHVRTDAQAPGVNCITVPCISDDLGLHESDLDILRNAFPEDLEGGMPVTSGNANSGVVYNSKCSMSVENDSPDRILRDGEIPDALKDSSIDLKCSSVERPFPSQLSSERKIFSSPEDKQLSTFHSRSDNRQNICGGPCEFESKQHSHSPKSGAMLLGVGSRSTDIIDPSATLDGDFTDLPDSLLNLSNEDDILSMEADVIPNSPIDIPQSGLNNNESEVVKDSNTNVAVPDDFNPLGFEVNTSPLHGLDVRSDCEGDMPTALALDPEIKRLSEGRMLCTLNTEDTEIPCNDDIFLLIHPSTSFTSTSITPIGQSFMGLLSVGNKNEQRVSSFTRGKDSVKSLGWTNKVGPNICGEKRLVQPAVSSTSHLKLSGTATLALLPGDANKGARVAGQSISLPANTEVFKDDVQEKDIVRVREVGDTLATSIEMPQFGESSSLRVDVTDPAINPSTSELEEPQSDDDVPYFSDIEAMILEMDLDPHSQDSYTTWPESKYQSEEFKRTTVRLEQCARSGQQRDMSPRGAFAVLYGRHLKYYIRKTEVILGRATDDIEVDIDLRKEGRANKISRRQAMIKMELDGSFRLKNLGKCSIAANGRSVDPGDSLTLSSTCLIEIREMTFVFEVNPKHVKKYIYRNTQNKERLCKFEWSPERKP